MERLLRKVASRRLGLDKKLLQVVDHENEIAKLNKYRIERYLDEELQRVKQQGISMAEFEYFGSPDELRQFIYRENDPNAGAIMLAQQRFRSPEVAATLHYMRQARSQLMQQEYATHTMALYQYEIKMARVARQRYYEETERSESIKERAEAYSAKLNGLYQSFRAKTEQMQQQQVAYQKQKYRYLEELIGSRNSAIAERRQSSIDRMQRCYQLAYQNLDYKRAQVGQLRKEESYVYFNFTQRRQALFERMRERAAQTDSSLKQHSVERENRYQSYYYRKAGLFKRRQESYSHASANFIKSQQEQMREKADKQQQQWNIVRCNYEKLNEFDFANKDQKWTREQQQHEAARYQEIARQLAELAKLKDYNDFKQDLAKMKRVQQRKQLDYQCQVHNLHLQRRFAKVDEFLSYKAQIQNQNYQYGINDTYRAAQEMHHSLEADLQDTKPLIANDYRAMPKRYESAQKVVFLDQYEVEYMVADFESKESEVKKQIQRAPLAEKVRLLQELRCERDRITEMQRQINYQVITRIASGRV